MAHPGTLRAYWLGAVVCSGGLLLGYDSGVVGGVLTLPSFQRDFGIDDHKARTTALVVSLQQLGAFLGCFLVWPITRRYGRRAAIVAGSSIFCIAAVFQTLNLHSLKAFYFFRLIAGLGIGAISVVCPIYSSEMAPKELRGQIGSFLQLMFTFGIFASYWVDYAVSQAVSSNTSRQWQIAIGCQLIPAGLLALGMLTLKESTRWLTVQGRHAEAMASLSWIRASDGENVKTEMREIRDGVRYEQRAKVDFRIEELYTNKDTFRRLCTAVSLFVAQQATGATAFAYYGPQYFQLLVDDVQKDLLLTAIFGAVKIIACGTFVLFVAESVRRKRVLVYGGLFMAACQICAAAIIKVYPVKKIASAGALKIEVSSSSVTGPSLVTVILIYAFVAGYNWSWGPLPAVCVSELFPTRTREIGVAIAVAAQWLFNFVFTIGTPYMIETLGWGNFLLWGLFDLVVASLVLLFLQETKGRSLEDITGTVQSARMLGQDSDSGDEAALNRPGSSGSESS